MAAAAPQNFQVLPNKLDIGETFQGAEIKVSAEIPAGFECGGGVQGRYPPRSFAPEGTPWWALDECWRGHSG